VCEGFLPEAMDVIRGRVLLLEATASSRSRSFILMSSGLFQTV
jgi:hypothetical protein